MVVRQGIPKISAKKHKEKMTRNNSIKHSSTLLNTLKCSWYGLFRLLAEEGVCSDLKKCDGVKIF